MKATDLMIGDWVKHAVTDEVLQVSEFTLNEDLEVQRYYVNGNLVGNVEPIPLTAEILENNGWEYGNWGSEDYDDEYYTFIDDFDIHIDENQTFEIRTVDGCTIKLKYVHELQHALRLCGIEKEIVL